MGVSRRQPCMIGHGKLGTSRITARGQVSSIVANSRRGVFQPS